MLHAATVEACEGINLEVALAYLLATQAVEVDDGFLGGRDNPIATRIPHLLLLLEHAGNRGRAGVATRTAADAKCGRGGGGHHDFGTRGGHPAVGGALVDADVEGVGASRVGGKLSRAVHNGKGGHGGIGRIKLIGHRGDDADVGTAAGDRRGAGNVPFHVVVGRGAVGADQEVVNLGPPQLEGGAGGRGRGGNQTQGNIRRGIVDEGGNTRRVLNCVVSHLWQLLWRQIERNRNYTTKPQRHKAFLKVKAGVKRTFT
jgi:hypothetical protein